MPRTGLRRIPRAAALVGAAALGVAALEATRRLDRRAAHRDPAAERLVTPLTGRPVAVTSNDGTVLHAEIFGEEGAPTIVLAHGWTCSLDFWKLQTRELMGEFRVVAYDQRGHGRSGQPGRKAYTPTAIADDFQAVVEACVPAGERFVAAGHSMGGMTIVGWAGRHPREVESRLAGAALISTGMGDLLAKFGLRRPLAGGRVEQTIAAGLFRLPLGLPPWPNPLTLRFLRALCLGPGASAAVAAFCERMVLACPAESRSGFGSAFPRLDLYISVPLLTVPTVVLVGAVDMLTPPWHARKLCQELPDCVELAELDGIGHMAPLEAPEEVTSRIAGLARRHLVNTMSEPPLPVATGA